MTDESQHPHWRKPVNKGRFIPFDRTPKSADIRMETAVHNQIHHLHDGPPVSAIQFAKTLAASQKANAPTLRPRPGGYNRPLVNTSRPISRPVSRASHSPTKPK